MLQGWAWPSGEIILYLPSHRVPRANSKPRSSYLTSTPPCLCMIPNAHTYTHPTSPVHPPGESKTCNLLVAGSWEESWQKPNWNKGTEGHKEEESLQTTTWDYARPSKRCLRQISPALRNHIHTVNVSSVVLRDLLSGSFAIVRSLWALHESEVSRWH